MMAFVRSVTAASIFVSSRFIVSGRMSTKTGVAPVSTMAVAVLEKVKLGTMTSSPFPSPHRSVAISRALVPLVVKSAFWAPKRSSMKAWHFFVNWPSPQILCASMASLT